MREKKCILVSAPYCEKSDASSRPLRLRALVPSRSPPQFTAQWSTPCCAECGSARNIKFKNMRRPVRGVSQSFEHTSLRETSHFLV